MLQMRDVALTVDYHVTRAKISFPNITLFHGMIQFIMSWRGWFVHVI